MKKDHVYLSKRNVLTLLSKLNRLAEGEHTYCTLIKQDDRHSTYPQTMKRVSVTSVENDMENSMTQDNGVPHIFLTRDTLTDLAYQLTLTGLTRSIEVGGTMVVSIVADEQYYNDRPAGEVMGCDDPSLKE